MLGGTLLAAPSRCKERASLLFRRRELEVQFNSGVKATLTAPTTGAYAGILFFEAPNLAKSDFIFNPSPG